MFLRGRCRKCPTFCSFTELYILGGRIGLCPFRGDHFIVRLSGTTAALSEMTKPAMSRLNPNALPRGPRIRAPSEFLIVSLYDISYTSKFLKGCEWLSVLWNESTGVPLRWTRFWLSKDDIKSVRLPSSSFARPYQIKLGLGPLPSF